MINALVQSLTVTYVILHDKISLPTCFDYVSHNDFKGGRLTLTDQEVANELLHCLVCGAGGVHTTELVVHTLLAA